MCNAVPNVICDNSSKRRELRHKMRMKIKNQKFAFFVTDFAVLFETIDRESYEPFFMKSNSYFLMPISFIKSVKLENFYEIFIPTNFTSFNVAQALYQSHLTFSDKDLIWDKMEIESRDFETTQLIQRSKNDQDPCRLIMKACTVKMALQEKTFEVKKMLIFQTKTSNAFSESILIEQCVKNKNITWSKLKFDEFNESGFEICDDFDYYLNDCQNNFTESNVMFSILCVLIFTLFIFYTLKELYECQSESRRVGPINCNHEAETR
jgi:hypothetical protein